jgi:hypothetical protein
MRLYIKCKATYQVVYALTPPGYRIVPCEHAVAKSQVSEQHLQNDPESVTVACPSQLNTLTVHTLVDVQIYRLFEQNTVPLFSPADEYQVEIALSARKSNNCGGGVIWGWTRALTAPSGMRNSTP